MILSLATIGGISFVLALSGVLIPGPLLTITISETMRRLKSQYLRGIDGAIIPDLPLEEAGPWIQEAKK